MNLIKAIKSQFFIMINKKNFWISFYILLGYSIGSYLYYIYALRDTDVSLMMSSSSLFIGNSYNKFFPYFEIIFPLIVSLPFAFSYFDDKEINASVFFKTRTYHKNYHLSKVITCFIGGFIIIFIPFVINIFLNSITFLENGKTFWGYIFDAEFCLNILGGRSNDKPLVKFIEIFINNPIIYNLIYTLLLSILSGTLSILSYVCSFRIKNKIFVFLPVYIIFTVANVINKFTKIELNLLEYVTIGKNQYSLWIIGIFIILVGIYTHKKIRSAEMDYESII